MRSLFALRRLFGSNPPNYTAKKYTKSHEWFEFFPQKRIARVGISDHAQAELGEIIHIEFPTIGKNLEAAQSALVIESVKVAADVYSPVTGEVVATNTEVEKNPTMVNEKAEEAWLFEIHCDKEPENLLTEE